MSNVLQEYLVKIGFNTDEPAFNRLLGVMASAEQSVTAHTGGMAKRILEAQGAIVGAFTGISAAIIGTVDKVAMADQGYRMLGLRMLMTTDSARKMDMISKGLGASLQEIIWDPELHARAKAMSQDIDRMTAGLGPGFEGKMLGIRDMRFEFSRLEVATKFLGMSFVSKLFDKLVPGEAGDKIKRFVDWFQSKIPELADKLANYAVPVLRQTWEMMKQLGEVAKGAGLVFTNFIGLLSGDTAIEGTAFSFEKLAKAIGHVGGWMAKFFGWIAHAEQLLAHFTSAMALALHGKFSEAASEFKAGLKDLTGGSGMVLGGTAGAAAGGLYGAIHGGIAGATAGSALGPLGALLGGIGGATLGTVGGGAAGAVVGGGAGKIRELIMPDDEKREASPRATASPVQPAAIVSTQPPTGTPAPQVIAAPEVPAASASAANAPAISRLDLMGAIRAAADRYHVSRSLALAVAQQESGIRQDRRSGAGAIGVMQLMPKTAADLGVDPKSALGNIDGGVRYLATLLRKYQGDTAKALAAYNAGPGKVDKARALSSLPSETRNYVPSVLRLEQQFSRESPVMTRDWSSVTAKMQRPIDAPPNVSHSQQTVSVDVGGVYITQPGADARQIQQSVAEGIRNGLRSQVQFDLAQLAPARG